MTNPRSDARMSAFQPVSSALHPGADLPGGVAESPFLTRSGHVVLVFRRKIVVRTDPLYDHETAATAVLSCHLMRRIRRHGTAVSRLQFVIRIGGLDFNNHRPLETDEGVRNHRMVVPGDFLTVC